MTPEDFVRRGQAAQAAVDALIAAKAADDRAQLAAIMDATSEPEHLANLVFTYYRDADRADRTSRSQMYLHLGMLAGAVLRALDAQKRRA